MKNKYFYLITLFFLSVILLTGCNDSSSQTEPTAPENTLPAVQTVPDETTEPSDTTKAPEMQDVQVQNDHGCVKEEGYTWCEAKQLCILEAKEKCEEVAEATPPKRSYNLIEEALAKKYNKSPDDFVMGIKKLTLTHFLGVVSQKEGIILAAKKNNDWTIVFDSVFGEKKTYICSEVAPFNFPADMIGDCAK